MSECVLKLVFGILVASVCVFAHAEELKEPVIRALPSSRGFTGLINTEHTKRS